MAHQGTSNEGLELGMTLEISLDTALRQLRARSVHLGKGLPKAILLIYSSEQEDDPWAEAFFFPKDTLKMALFTEKGDMLWNRDLGGGVMPGSHFCPVFSFDLDSDNTDEIWFVNNIDAYHPLSLNGRRLERMDVRTGKTTGQWPWPNLAGDNQSLSHTHRNFIFGGHVKGKPVLVKAQGTYGPMFLQGWQEDMNADEKNIQNICLYLIFFFTQPGMSFTQNSNRPKFLWCVCQPENYRMMAGNCATWPIGNHRDGQKVVLPQSRFCWRTP